MSDAITESIKDNTAFLNHEEKENAAYFWEEYSKAYTEVRMYGHDTLVVSGDAAVFTKNFVVNLLNTRRDVDVCFEIESVKKGLMAVHTIKLYKEE
jgi:hypothetical protein